MDEKQRVICNWCNQPAVIIWVHGHGQCSVCGINIDECCRGEEANPPARNSEQVEKDKIQND